VVKQKTPVARVLDRSGSFTLIMRVVYHCQVILQLVPLVSGKIDRKNSEKYAELLRVIYDDDFLKKTLFLSRLCPMED
jgi:cell division protein FtsQ